MRLRSKGGDPEPPNLGGNLDRQSVVTAPERLVRSRPGANKP